MLDYVNVIKNSTVIIGDVEVKRYRRALTNEALRDMRIFIQEIWEAGYATDKFYPANVIKIAEKCGLIPKIMG
jgi:flagellum-specific peptidoglycan hydrolase FlgJ